MQAIVDAVLAKRRFQPTYAPQPVRQRSTAIIEAELGAVVAAIDPAANYSDDGGVILRHRELMDRAAALRAELQGAQQ